MLKELKVFVFCPIGEVGATPKLLNLDIKKIGKGTPGIISDGVF